MKYLAINSSPYSLDFAVFKYESKKLLQYGTSYYHEKDNTKRIIEIWEDINELLDELHPNIVVTQMLDLRYTLKRDLENIMQVRTLLRLACYKKNIMFNEFRTLGWEKRITNLKKPSKKAKLKIAKEYSNLIDREEIADAIILCESVVWNRLQIGKE
jgi:Holliday junction resolvasome RuvABC endonuclease subunit